jgi:hypothetical protein
MSEDAKFEDGQERPLHLKALDAEDLQVIAALAQDSVFPASEIQWDKNKRRFGILLNRFRWEDVEAAHRAKRSFERVQAVLVFDDVLKVSSQGVKRGEADTVLSLLEIAFHPGEDGGGRIEMTLAGDGAIALEVEAIDATLKDVTRPYVAPSGAQPVHD